MKTFKKSVLLLALTNAFSVAAVSKFDPTALLHVELNTEEIPTERTNIPEGEHRYVIGKPKFDSGEKDGKPWARLILPLKLDEPSVLAELELEAISASYSFFIDLNEQGGIAVGPNLNVKLGQLYEACQLAGDSVTIAQVEGKQVIGKTYIKTGTSGNEYNEIGALASID